MQTTVAPEKSEGSLAGEEMLQNLASTHEKLLNEVGKAIVGQRKIVDDVLLGLFCGEHVLLTGVPGLAKTLLVKSLGDALSLDCSRIQFTPDLMPADITGTEVIQEDLETGKRKLEFFKGPVFTNLLLADEINRTPAKTQAAMLQTMQEREVSVGGKTYQLPRPFHVFATQNPIEQEGTYQLPEAAVDRFMLSVNVDYPELEDEISIVDRTTGTAKPDVQPVLGGEDILKIQEIIRSIPVSKEVIRYAVELVASTRPGREGASKETNEFVRWGAGPRASQYLILGAKGRAALSGKPCANFEDVRSVAVQVLEHRVLPNFKARAQNVTSAELVRRLLSEVKEG